jgi:hypothetical protein
MAKIELRHATIRLKDGFAGTALVNEPTTPPANGDTNMDIDTVSVNGPLGTNVIPVGARFTFTADTNTTFVVTGRTPADGSAATTNIVFTPALQTGQLPADNATLTFAPIELEVKVGEGNLTYTESKEMNYELDRGTLDTVRQGDDQPCEVNLEFVYEFVTTGTGEDTTPVDALKRQNDASEWTSSSSDQCEPYAVDIEVEHAPPCGTAQKEITLFPDFRHEQLEFDLGEATISVSGKINATEPTITREDQ